MTAACHIAVLRALSCRLEAMLRRRLVSNFGCRTFYDVPESAVFGKRHTRTLLSVALEGMRARTGCTMNQARSGQTEASIEEAPRVPSPVEGRPASTRSTCCFRSSLFSEMCPTRATRVPLGMHLAAQPRRVAGAAVADHRTQQGGGDFALGPAAAAVAAAVAVR
jgi:hypothetical protein